MFERLKEKLNKGKEWVKENKSEIKVVVYGAAMCVAGAVAANAVSSYDDKKKREKSIELYSNEMKILSMKPQADYIDGIWGSGVTRLDELSDKLIYNGGVADSKVIGALVYTKK